MQSLFLSKQQRSKIANSFLLLFVLVFTHTTGIFAQPPVAESVIILPTTGKVRQTPCEEYTEPGSTVLQWDWRQPDYTIYYFPGNGPSILREIPSPFSTDGFSLQPNTFFLIGSSLDPSDGWELLYRDFGTPPISLGDPGKPVGEPSFALYNRKTAMVRVFFWIEPNGEEVYQTALLSATHLDNSPTSTLQVAYSALFEHLNIPANPLSQFDKSGLEAAQINRLIINGNWHILEFIAAYDPCVCEATSFVSFNPILSGIETQTFTIDGTGVSEATYSAGSSSGNYLGKALKYGSSAVETIDSGIKIYKNFNEFLNDSDKSKAAKFLQDHQWLDWLGDIVPGGSAALKILGFFVGKDDSSRPTLTGFNHDFQFTGTGQNTYEGFYESKVILTPGSFYAVNQVVQSLRPVYDNPLGLMNVLTLPKIQKVQSSVYPQYKFTTYRYLGPLEYVVNQFAEIGAPVRLEGSLVWTDCQNGDGFFATPSTVLGCLDNYHVITQNNPYQSGIVGLGNEYEYWNFLAANAPNCEGEPVLQITAFFADGLIFSSRYKVEIITAPYSFESTPGIPIVTEDDPPVGVSCSSTDFDPPASSERLTTFCENTYNPALAREVHTGGIESIPDDDNTTGQAINSVDNITDMCIISPNPFKDQLTFKAHESLLGSPAVLQIMDNMGRTIWQKKLIIAASEITITNGLTTIPAGNYYFRVITEKGVNTQSLIKY